MSNHTPGPWSILFSRGGYPYQIHATNGDNQKPGAVGSSITRWGAISLPSSAEGLANARLIAAAPELLDALLAMFNSSDPEIAGSPGSTLEMARAAIAKATGATP